MSKTDRSWYRELSKKCIKSRYCEVFTVAVSSFIFFEEFYFFLWFDYKFDENEMAIVQTRMGGDLKNNKSVDQELHNFSIHTKNLNSGNVRSFDTKNIDVAWSELG